MIRVNLMKDRSNAPAEDMFGDGGDELSKQETIDIAKKVLVMSIATISMLVYESIHVDNLKNEYTKAKAAVAREKKKLQADKKELSNYADVEKDAKELEDKIGILKTLSRVRLREVKAFDFIQTATPETVWFDSIVYENEKFKFIGYAVTDDDLSQFIKELESSPYFVDVILMKANEQETKQGTVKVFEIQSKAGDIG